MSVLLSALVNFTYIFSGLWVISYFLEKRSCYKVRLLIVSILTVSQSFVSLLGIPMLNAITSLLLIILATLICFKCNKKIFIIYDILVFASSFISDILATLCFSVISENTITTVLQQTNLIVARHVLACILILALCSISFTLIRKKQASLVWYEVFIYGLLAIGETFTVDYIAVNTLEKSSGNFIVFFLIGCFVLNIYIVYVFHRISIVRKTEKENALLRQQSNLQLTVYQELQDRYERSIKIVHDVKKHVSALEDLIIAENYDIAENYKESLFKELNKLQPAFRNKSKILTVIINDELIKAEKYNIEMEMIIDDVNIDILTDIDITTIISNILDNAIEAVSELPECKRRILFIIKEKMSCLIIHSENCYENVNMYSQNKFSSTKKDHHGIGLKNIESTVNKYGGVFSIELKDGIFKNLITIPY